MQINSNHREWTKTYGRALSFPKTVIDNDYEKRVAVFESMPEICNEKVARN